MNKIFLYITLAVQSIVILLLLFYSGVATIPSPSDSQIKEIVEKKTSPTPEKLSIEMTGWFAAWDQNKAQEALPRTMDKTDVFSPMLYRIQIGGVFERHNIENRTQIINFARDKDIPIAPVITDESDPVRVSRLLGLTAVQDKFIDDMVAEAKNENFIGWSIDIEQLRSTQREAFTNFIKKAAEKLHDNDLKLFVIVFAKEEKETYNPALAHDYKALGMYADEVQIMTYNYNNESTGPGGQTPIEWYRKVLTNAKKNIPSEKILIGLSTHGYDWADDEVQGLTYNEVKGVIDQYKARISYDEKEAANLASYTADDQKHTLWFEDAASIYKKMQIAQNEFGIKKFALWRISAEDTSIWDMFN